MQRKAGVSPAVRIPYPLYMLASFRSFRAGDVRAGRRPPRSVPPHPRCGPFAPPFPLPRPRHFFAMVNAVQTFGRKKTAVAVAHCKQGRGLVKVNGCPLNLVQPELLRAKVFEPLLLLGEDKFAGVDIRVRVRGGGYTSQIYAIRQAISKAIVAYYQKYVDEASKKEIKDVLVSYDRSLLVADPRRCEPKKFGGRGARARFQKSYR